jgi:hypothetical protein
MAWLYGPIAAGASFVAIRVRSGICAFLHSEDCVKRVSCVCGRVATPAW